MAKKDRSKNKNRAKRPPIVTILGHVDHGKTTLLDKIRQSHITKTEHGGITQHIGAYQITYKDKKDKDKIKKITFIDTPGHVAFAKMRSRGAKVADIAVLVVAADDGVMPQTVESIDHIKNAGMPFIAAVNKIDLRDTNIEKIKKQLTKLDIQLEEYGGEVPVVPLSAKTGEGIDKLFSMIFLIAELNQIGQDPTDRFQGVVIESRLSKTQGAEATVLVRSGKVSVYDILITHNQEFKVKAMTDWQGKKIIEALPSFPVKIVGWSKVPLVGSLVLKKNETSKTFEEEIHKKQTEVKKRVEKQKIAASSEKKLNLIIKTDVYGSLEAILPQLAKDKINIVSSSVSQINESDILLAKSTTSIVVGFNVKPLPSAAKLAQTEKVIIKTYKIIYNLIQEIGEAADILLNKEVEKVSGKAKVLKLFQIGSNQIAGVKVKSGKLKVGDKVNIKRQEQTVGKSKIKSLRYGKKNITEAEKDKEAGVLLSPPLDLLTGDDIIVIG